ncbi:hypothetical protein [Neobacillus vireti]|uniref:hypothetical protein n=1 Tax=Neobacillus vireti TaxID=220686 RepID=UPI002FFDDD7B
MKKIHLGQCRGAGVTEDRKENTFGSMERAGVTGAQEENVFESMQRCWSDRSARRKCIWVNAEVLE